MLECPNAREALRRLLPERMDELRAAISTTNLHIMTAVLESIWGHVSQAAGVILEQSAVGEAASSCSLRDGVEREAQLYWDRIAPGTQGQLLQFFRQKQFEDRNYKGCTETLKRVARAFFDPSNEAAGVRPLSMALGYIPNCTHDYCAMTLGHALSVHQHSRLPEDLSLLQPCRQNPALTKYQGLFQVGEEYDGLRIWFFHNHRYNVHQQKADR